MSSIAPNAKATKLVLYFDQQSHWRRTRTSIVDTIGESPLQGPPQTLMINDANDDDALPRGGLPSRRPTE